LIGHIHRNHLAIILALGILLGVRPASAIAQSLISITEIGPKQSSLDADDPDGASGGRVNGISVDATSNEIMFAASEWGGLFKSADQGRSWTHVDGHVPHATWDVAIDPSDSERIIATSFYDGRVKSRAGINVSINGGVTWVRPTTTLPPKGFCISELEREEPSAFGIAFDSVRPNNVYIGTNCGLAVSQDNGVTWRFIDPTPEDGADNIWDVIVHHGGILDVCGDDGHLRSTNGGTSWNTAPDPAQGLIGGRCSLAVSPDEAHVLFAVVGETIFDSVDGGITWLRHYSNPNPQGRIPFVATNKRDTGTYDLWFGDIELHRGSCKTPSPSVNGGNKRCEASDSWAGPFTRDAGGHDDVGDILFETKARNACPLLFSSDGGVYFNTVTKTPDCHTPVWEQPIKTPQAVWNWDMEGVARTGVTKEGLYFGNQDTGTFGTEHAGTGNPNWWNDACCDGFDIVADTKRVLTTVCCSWTSPSTRLYISDPGLDNTREIGVKSYPPGRLRRFEQLDSIAQFGADSYVIATDKGVFVTTNITADPIVWRQLGRASAPNNACGIQVSRSGGRPIFFVKGGDCNGQRGSTLWRYEGTAQIGIWKQIKRPGGGQFGVYDVDPTDARRIIASDLGSSGDPEMVMTVDSGRNWSRLTELDRLMSGNGVFRYRTRLGPTRWTSFEGYPQPTLISFDPVNPDIIIAGAADSGVFLSMNSAARWKLITDPNNPGTSGTPHIPRPRYVHFDHDEKDQLKIYLGTQGRGQWRITLRGKNQRWIGSKPNP